MKLAIIGWGNVGRALGRLLKRKRREFPFTVTGIHTLRHGTVVNAAPKSVYVTIRVDDSTNTKMRVLRSAIARVGQPDETEADAKEAS